MNDFNLISKEKAIKLAQYYTMWKKREDLYRFLMSLQDKIEKNAVDGRYRLIGLKIPKHIEQLVIDAVEASYFTIEDNGFGLYDIYWEEDK